MIDTHDRIPEPLNLPDNRPTREADEISFLDLLIVLAKHKTLVLGLLGLSPRAGLACGRVRHARELLWAAGGLAAYGSRRRTTAT